MHSLAHEVFGQALDQPQRLRLDWLRQQCADDPALFAAVERLLIADAHGSLLDEEAAAVAGSLMSSDENSES